MIYFARLFVICAVDLTIPCPSTAFGGSWKVGGTGVGGHKEGNDGMSVTVMGCSSAVGMIYKDSTTGPERPIYKYLSNICRPRVKLCSLTVNAYRPDQEHVVELIRQALSTRGPLPAPVLPLTLRPTSV